MKYKSVGVSQPATRILLLPILLFSFALRLYQLDSQSFWVDEVLTVLHVNVPLLNVLLGLPSDHTPGYFVLLHYLLPILGDVDFSIRFVSVFWGTLSVTLIYVLGSRLVSSRVGLIAALLALVNPFAVYYSQEARMYTQLLALGTAALYWFARAFERPQRSRFWIAHTLALAGALYTHYYALALPLAEGGFTLLERVARQPIALRNWIKSLLGVAALFLPWTPFFLHLVVAGSWQKAVNPLTYPAELWTIFLAGTTMPPDTTSALFAATGILLALGIYAASKRWQGRLLVLMLLVPFVVVLAALTLRGMGPFPRYLIVLLPAFLLLVAMGIERATRRVPALALGGVAIAALIALVSLQNYWYDPHYSRPGWRQAAEWLASHEEPGDIILIDGSDPNLEFRRYYRGHSRYAAMPEFKPRASAESVRAAMSRLTAGAARAWLATMGGQTHHSEEWLSTVGFKGDYEEFAGIYVSPHLLSPELQARRTPISVNTSLDVALVDAQWGIPHAGRLLPIALTWRQGSQRSDTDLQVSVRLVDARGEVVVALDRAPRDGFHPTSQWQPGETIEDKYALTVPDTLAPGEYALRVLLYDPADGAPRLEATLGAIHIGTAAAGN